MPQPLATFNKRAPIGMSKAPNRIAPQTQTIATRINTSDGRMVLMRKLPDGRIEVVTHVSPCVLVFQVFQA